MESRNYGLNMVLTKYLTHFDSLILMRMKIQDKKTPLMIKSFLSLCKYTKQMKLMESKNYGLKYGTYKIFDTF